MPSLTFSKNLGTLWEDLAKVVEGEDEIEVGQVDCSTNKPVCTKVDIHSYPTFKVFYDGEEIAKYKGKLLDVICLVRLYICSLLFPLSTRTSLSLEVTLLEDGLLLPI